tara:strand:- start:668 stop:1387 length:720 start_codon:yes stop_codon:yes gene_type:complete
MPERALLALCLWWTAGSAAAMEAIGGWQVDTVGRAYDRDSGELLYSEFYACDDDGLRCVVDYRDAGGEAIAFKTLDYSASLHAPALEMRDLRADRQYSLPAPQRGDLVVDAGFDNYVRSRWDELSRGDTVVFPFRVLGIERPITMRAGIDAGRDCAADRLCLRVEVDSWWLGLLAEPIELAYRRATRQLLRFSGVSNLRDARGRAPQVDIRYEYPAQDVDAAPVEPAGAKPSQQTTPLL